MKTPNITPINRNGFTLVELLVVIVIVAVLVSLSVGGLFRFRKSADKLNTASSLKQMQVANVAYASDHNGKYVVISSKNDEGVEQDWTENTDYLAALFGDGYVFKSDGTFNTKVPDGFLDQAYVKANAGSPFKDSFSKGPYGYNENSETIVAELEPNKDATFGGTRVTQVKNPAKTAAFALSSDSLFKYDARLGYLKNPTDKPDASGMLIFRYGGKVPVAFYDGHVEFISPEQINKYDAEGRKNNPFWSATAGP